MDCDHVNEILPWLLNGTLETAERQRAREHLSLCEKCRQGLQETASVLAAHQQHVPEETLVDYVFNRTTLNIERDLVERHLEKCDQCAAELKMLEESHRLLNAEDNLVPFRPRVRATESMPSRVIRLWAYGAIAASLIGFVALIGWWWNWQQSRALRASLVEQQRSANERLARLETENQQLRQLPPQPVAQLEQANQQIARLQGQVKELSAPQVNIPVLEIFPQERLERGETKVNQLQIPRGPKTLTVILNSQSTTESKDLGLEILDARQSVVWSQQGLVRHSTGDYTLNIPTELLPAGSYTFVIYSQVGGRRVKVESYPVHIATSQR